MRALVFLVAISYCSAQLVYNTAPWVLPTAKLITPSEADSEVKSVALASPYLHPFSTPYFHPFSTAYSHPLGLTPYSLPLGHHLPYVLAADGTLKATEFPYIYEKVAAPAAEEPAVEEARRRRRDVTVPLPYIHAVPTVKDVTVETKQFEATDAATPADTTKIELTTKEHEISVPAVKYVQPHVNLKPITYTAFSPAYYHHPTVLSPAVLPYHYAGFPALAHAPVVKIDE